jgi:hypothetical protein
MEQQSHDHRDMGWNAGAAAGKCQRFHGQAETGHSRLDRALAPTVFSFVE